jgi:hypothetical protein
LPICAKHLIITKQSDREMTRKTTFALVAVTMAISIVDAEPQEVPADSGGATIGERLNAMLFHCVAGRQIRTVAHEDAHRRAAVRIGCDAWFDTGDRDPRCYAEHHPVLKEGYFTYRVDSQAEQRLTWERLRFIHTAGLNAEADIAINERLPWEVRVPAQLVALLYTTKPEYSDFHASNVSRNRLARQQVGAALVSWTIHIPAAVYLNERGASLKVVKNLGADTRVEFETTGSESETALSHTYHFDRGIGVAPKVTTNGKSLGVGCVVSYRSLTIEAVSQNPKTLSGYRGSNGAERTTYEVNLGMSISL